jgi:putative flippase GtrA
LGAGAFNTIATFLLYQILVFVIPYPVAYTMSFVSGVALAAVVNAQFVFGARLTWLTGIRFVAMYLALYALGLGITIAQVSVLDIPERIAPIVAAVLIFPVSYIGSWVALIGRSPA